MPVLDASGNGVTGRSIMALLQKQFVKDKKIIWFMRSANDSAKDLAAATLLGAGGFLKKDLVTPRVCTFLLVLCRIQSGMV